MSNPTFAQGELLAQLSPGGTTAVELYAAPADALPIEIPLILGCIYSGSGIVATLYHAQDGSTFDNTTIIGTFNKTTNDSPVLFQSPGVGSGIMLKPGEAIGVKVGTANSINFSLYGITATIAEYIRGRDVKR